MSEWAIVGMLWCACSPIVLRFAKTVDTLVLQKKKKRCYNQRHTQLLKSFGFSPL